MHPIHGSTVAGQNPGNRVSRLRIIGLEETSWLDLGARPHRWDGFSGLSPQAAAQPTRPRSRGRPWRCPDMTHQDRETPDREPLPERSDWESMHQDNPLRCTSLSCRLWSWPPLIPALPVALLRAVNGRCEGRQRPIRPVFPLLVPESGFPNLPHPFSLWRSPAGGQTLASRPRGALDKDRWYHLRGWAPPSLGFRGCIVPITPDLSSTLDSLPAQRTVSIPQRTISLTLINTTGAISSMICLPNRASTMA
jgi:hypothetical protein